MVLDNNRNILVTHKETIFLSIIENIILTLFVENKDRIITIMEILKALEIYGVDKNTLRVHICRLNKKIEKYMSIYSVGHLRYKLYVY